MARRRDPASPRSSGASGQPDVSTALAAARARMDGVAAEARRRAATAKANLRLPAVPALTPPTLKTLPLSSLPTLPTLPPVLPSTSALPELPALQEARRAREARSAYRRLLALGVVVVALLLLLLLRTCEDEPVAAVDVVEVLTCPEPITCGPAKKKPPRPAKKSPPKVPGGKTVPQPRDVLAVPESRNPPWLAALRLQVSARSLALATCFNGTEKPGALRLSALVSPGPGTLGDAELTPLQGSTALTGGQKVCLLNVLTTPPYRLTTPGDVIPEQMEGTRISLILEF